MSKQSHIEIKCKSRTAYFEVTTKIQYITIILEIFFIEHIYIPGQFPSYTICQKRRVREPGGNKGDDDKKVNITDGLCVDGDVPPYRILSLVHVSGTKSSAFTLPHS